jgi:hypothetical protein
MPRPKRKRKIPRLPKDSKDPEWLLKWLEHLRLHKYAVNLQAVSPEELLDLGEEDLLARVVDTLGARTKLLVICDFECGGGRLLILSI